MSLIDPQKIDRRSGINFHDLIRDGRSTELDPVKVSALLNALIESNNELHRKLERTYRDLLKIKKRKKPGPKPKTKKKN